MSGTPAMSVVDHGYAWIVLLSCVMMRVLVEGLWSSLGFLSVTWGMHFNASASAFAWIGSTFMLLSCPISSALAHRFTYRVVVICAGILTSCCLLAMSIVTQLWHLYLLMPLLGFGLGLNYQAGFTFYYYYFDKRFALACGLSSAASGLGYLVFAPLLEILVRFYTWRGALQITSAILSNLCVCGLLLRPSTLEERNQSGDDKDYSNIQENKRPDARSTFFRNIAKDFDLSLFRNVRFIFQGVLNGLLYSGRVATIIFIVPHAINIGISAQKSAFLMSALGISMTIIRVSPVGLIVDKKIISASTLGGIALVISGLAIVSIPFLTSYVWLMVAIVVCGLTHGVGEILLLVVLASAAGSKDKAPGATAWFMLFNGVASLFSIFITGYLYDSSGSYRSSLILGGVCVIAMGFNVSADPLLTRWQTHLDSRVTDTK